MPLKADSTSPCAYIVRMGGNCPDTHKWEFSMIAAYRRHCLRAKAQGFKPLPFKTFNRLTWVLA